MSHNQFVHLWLDELHLIGVFCLGYRFLITELETFLYYSEEIMGQSCYAFDRNKFSFHFLAIIAD
jgi:hypothetical protein